MLSRCNSPLEFVSLPFLFHFLRVNEKVCDLSNQGRESKIKSLSRQNKRSRVEPPADQTAVASQYYEVDFVLHQLYFSDLSEPDSARHRREA